LLDKCGFYYEKGEVKELTASVKKQINSINGRMASRALRVIGVACKREGTLPQNTPNKLENNLIFVGLIGMIDPPRPEVPEAVRQAIGAGIKPVMITGDHMDTALAIAEEIGIASGGLHLTGAELNAIPQEKLVKDIHKYDVFARVSPEHKVRIVKAFQSRGATVAMTGDGVNDAPALRSADIGCAMGINGTEVAKSAADIVLADDNFATIVEAVRLGRGIFTNIQKAVHFLISSNIGELMTILLAVLMGWNSPLAAIHLLWVNLVTDSLPAIALGMDPIDKNVMKRKPVNRKRGLFTDGLWLRIVLEGMMIGSLTLISYCIGMVYFDCMAVACTMAFATLSISQLVHAFNMRSDKSVLGRVMLGNIYLIGAFAAGLFLQITVISVPMLQGIFKVVSLDGTQWAVVAVLSVIPLFVVELQKKVLNGVSINRVNTAKAAMAKSAG
jgi:Ca2+-transporting ATPase